jgi:hypothetical protein
VQGVIVDVGAPKTAARCEADGAAQWTSCVDDALVSEVAVGCGSSARMVEWFGWCCEGIDSA